MKSILIAGFPGIGKSEFYKKYKEDTSDSDSSGFSKDNFPQNYIEHIKSLIGVKKFTLISAHKEVLNGLENEGLDYVLVYPHSSLKEEYIQRYITRGSPEAFVNLLDNKWDEFMDDLTNAKPSQRIELKQNQFLTDFK